MATLSDEKPGPAWRRWAAAILVVLTSIAWLGTVLAVSARATLFDTDRFMSVVGPTLDDPAAYAALGDFVADEALAALDLEGRLSRVLGDLDALIAEVVVSVTNPSDRLLQLLERANRPTLVGLAPGLASNIEERVRGRIQDVITSDAVTDSMPVIVERGHAGLMSLLQGDTTAFPNVYVADGEVRLNLIPLIISVLETVASEIRDVTGRIELPSRVSDRADAAIVELRRVLGDSVSDDFGQLSIMSEAQLDRVQTTWSQLDRLMWGWALLTLTLAVAAVAGSPRRRRTSLQLGLGLVVAVTLGIIVVSRLDSGIAGALGDTEGGRIVAGLLGDAFSRVRSIMWVVVVVGVLAIAGALAYQPDVTSRSDSV